MKNNEKTNENSEEEKRKQVKRKCQLSKVTAKKRRVSGVRK